MTVIVVTNTQQTKIIKKNKTAKHGSQSVKYRIEPFERDLVASLRINVNEKNSDINNENTDNQNTNDKNQIKYPQFELCKLKYFSQIDKQNTNNDIVTTKQA